MMMVMMTVAPIVLKNDEITFDELRHLLYEERAFHNVVISPGPGTPTRPKDIGKQCPGLILNCLICI